MFYSGVATFLLLKLVGVVLPLRADASDEGLGMDVSQHGEEAYAEGEGAVLILPDRAGGGRERDARVSGAGRVGPPQASA
jgi:Amt family ammonium transporter